MNSKLALASAAAISASAQTLGGTIGEAAWEIQALQLQRDYWRAMYRKERAIRMQPVSRAIDEGARARETLKKLRAAMRAAGVKP